MKIISRIFVWLSFIFALFKFSLITGPLFDYLFYSVSNIMFRTVLEVIFLSLLCSFLLFSVIELNEKFPKLFLFWSFMFCDKKALTINQIKTNNEFCIINIYDEYVLVNGEGETKKIFGVNKYFNDLKAGDAIYKTNNTLNLKTPMETKSVLI